MRTKAALSALTLFSLGVAAELTAPDGYGGVVASGASECLIKEGSRRDIKIKDFSYGESKMKHLPSGLWSGRIMVVG